MTRDRKKRDVIIIKADLVQSVFSWSTCNCSPQDNFTTADFDFRIRRLGEDEFCIAYTPFCADENGLTFLWDDLLYDLADGMYEGVMYQSDVACFAVDMVKKKNSAVKSTGITNKNEGCDGVC